MDKSKDVNKRLNSETKKNGMSKTVLKNSHIAIKSNPPRKFSYISRAKSVSNPYENKKYNVYTSDTKSFLKQTCDKCRMGSSSHLVVNAAPVKPPTQLSKVDANHNLNGNLSFNPHTAFCNFPSVSEVPNFSLKYPSQQRYELSVQKSSKHKTRAGYYDKRTYNSKVTNSKVSFHFDQYYPTLPPSDISYQSSKSNPSPLSNAIPFIKLSTNRMCGTALVSEKLNPKCFIKPGELMNEQITTDIKVTNFPVYAQSNLPGKTCFAVQVDPENQMCSVKSDYFIHKWQQISVASLFENPSDFKDKDKTLFPALPSNIQNEQIKSNYNSGNRPLSELSYEDQSDLEGANTVPRIVSNEDSIGNNTASIIPQASYADVIRMSGSCSGSIVNSDKISDSEQTLPIPLDKKESLQSGSSDWVISRLSQQEPQSQNFRNVSLNHYNPNIQSSVNPHPIAVSLEKPSFYNSTLQNMKLHNISPSNSPIPSEKFVKGDDISNNASSSEENGDKMSSSSSAYSSSIPSDHGTSTIESQVTGSKPDSLFSSVSSTASKSTDKLWNKKSTSKNKEFPVILMNNSCPSDNMSEITFGIEYDEMIKLCFDDDDCDLARENASTSVETNQEIICSEKNIQIKNSLKPLENQVICDGNLVSQANPSKRFNAKLLFKETTLYWKESEVKYDENNHRELTNYFASLWKECERRPNSGLPDGDKIQIYQERK